MRLIERCYNLLTGRRWLALTLLLILIAGCLWSLRGIIVDNDIRSLLPDGDSHVARDFELLGKAPLSRKLIIQVHASEDIPKADLLKATALLSNQLDASALVQVTQLNQQQLGGLFSLLLNRLPLFLDEGDWQGIVAGLTPEAIDRALAEDRMLLMQPQGMIYKQRVQQDPLDFQRLVLAKLTALNPLPSARVEQGFFVSDDGRHSLLLAETAIEMTDVDGAERLQQLFAEAQTGLAQGVTAELLSGHLYTLENARAIQRDMRSLVLISALGLLLVFALFLRRLSAIAVYILPLLALLVATAATQLRYGSISGITFGFGAVLLGITIDFGLHVYFSLDRAGNDKGQQLAALARPLLTGGLTTLAAFAVLLGSVLPGQRQLAYFSIVGIATALILALFLLPHFIRSSGEPWELRGQRYPEGVPSRRSRRVILSLWLVVMLLAASQLGGLRVSGELRKLSYVSAELQQAESDLRTNWGSLRSSAMVIASGDSWEQAFVANERLWQILQDEALETQAVSLAPLLIAQQVQRQRVERWHEFWLQQGAEVLPLLEESRREYGFSESAFAPFVASWTQSQEPLPWQQLRSGGLEGLFDNFMFEEGGQYHVVSLLPDEAQLVTLLSTRLAAETGLEIISQSRFGSELGVEILSDFRRFIGIASLVIIALLLLVMRSLKKVLLTLLPVLSGLLFMLGSMAWLGQEINIFNVIASILVIGLGVDYGVFVVSDADQKQRRERRNAIVISGLTTLVGFGALALAQHPSLYSIGMTVMLGILAALPSAVLVVPLLNRRKSEY